MIGFVKKKVWKKVSALCAAALFASLCAGGALAAAPTANWNAYKNHEIATVSPENVTIHLFDYWITAENGQVGSGVNGAGRWVWDCQLPNGHLETGINQGHAFKFGGSGSALASNVEAWSNAGLWNKGTGFGFALVDDDKVEAYIENKNTAYPGLAGYTGIGGYTKDVGILGKTLVNRGLFLDSTLDENGYPKLNLNRVFKANVDYLKDPDHETAPAGVTAKPKSTNNPNGQYGPAFGWNTNWESESLQYLFDPTYLHVGKASFADVKGLLKVTHDGYYRFSSYQNFAAFEQSGETTLKNANNQDVPVPSGKFHVYKDKGITASGASPDGQFYPFNTPDQVLNTNGTYNSAIMSKGDKLTENSQVEINHFVGMTMEVPFQQPTRGRIGFGLDAQPMVFKFSGDDDTLIYIDGVLVADLSGCHDAITVHIDFSNGKIIQFFSPNQTDGNNPEDPLVPKRRDGSDVPTNESNLRAQFKAAGKENVTQWSGNTFAGGTVHTLKMFYLERGHTDSNLTLEFNLVQAAESALHKHNQDGESMAETEARLTLYKVNGTNGDTELNDLPQPDKDGSYALNQLTEIKSYDKNGAKITGGLGKAWLLDHFNELLSDNNTIGDGYFVLKETVTPAGYRPVRDVLLYYDQDGAGLLHVKNKWTTGARSSFRENSHTLDDKLYYYNYDNTTGGLTTVNNPENGLVVAVPLTKAGEDTWAALYGNHIWGYDAVTAYDEGADKAHKELKAVLDAALHQIYYTHYGDSDYQTYGEKWILSYNSLTSRYEAVLKNLPGEVEQYEWVYATQQEKADNAKMAVLYYYFDAQALSQLNAAKGAGKSLEKWEAIAKHIEDAVGTDKTIAKVDQEIKSIVNEIIGSGNSNERFHRLHRANFETIYTPDIYIPNIVNELRVCKLDHTQSERLQKTVTLPGAQFALYSDKNCINQIAQGTTDDDGMLLFSAEQKDGMPGAAHAVLETGKTYYLKEIGGTNGVATFNGVVYAINDSIVQVDVTNDGVLANATAINHQTGDRKDGIGVWIGVGKVVETMAMYAADGSLNDSLTQIQAVLMKGDRLDSLILDDSKLELAYEKTKAFLQYSPITDGDHNYFTIHDGYGHAHISQLSPDDNPNDDRENLKDYNIDPLFTGSTTVMVANHRLAYQYSFAGNKKLVGRELFPGEFQFDLYKADAARANAGQFVKGDFVERASNGEQGKINFKYHNIVDRTTSPQNFYYIIEEHPGDLLGVTYDNARYGVHVYAEGYNKDTTTDEYEGYKLELTYYKLDEKGKATKLDLGTPVEFVNSFVPPPLPTTGDDSNLALYAAIAALCVSCAALLAYRRRRV